jgi:pimeloyl-ACP methyl ester carboxylesterase
MRPLVLLVAVAACSQPAAQPADAAAVSPDSPPLADSPAVTTDYGDDGPVPYEVTTTTLPGSFAVTLYMPTSPGKHPVVAISCGTQQTAAGYASYGKRLASHGIAAVIEDDPGILTNTSDVLPHAEYVIETWLPTMADRIDLTRVGLAGHSRGGAVSLLTAEHEPGKVAAWFGLDPADNEFGQNPREYARTTLASLTIPTAFLGAGVTSNCAPVADSYEMLYGLAPSPSLKIVGIGAGHTQLEDPAGCTACSVCSPSGTADSEVVLAYATRYLTAFFARELLGDTAVGPALEGAGAPADVAAGLVTVTAK